jgi:histidinol-phosphate/aromatic aminotransferase/cobyric acid decarboxylase-like protein
LVQRQIEAIAARYPHAALISAAHALVAKRHAVPAESVQLFRGANEAIKSSITGIVKPGWRVLMPDITYIGHVKAAIAAGAEIAYLPLSNGLLRNLKERPVPAAHLIDAMLRVRPRALILGNPSNPLGDFFGADEFHRLFEASTSLQPSPTFFIDAAFEKFARVAGADVPDYTRYLDSGRIVVIESLSKADGYAGSRSGYIYGSPELVAKIAKLRWSHCENGPAAPGRGSVVHRSGNRAAIPPLVSGTPPPERV